MEISFDYPALLMLLLLTPLLIAAYFYNLKLKRKEALLFSNFEALEHVVGPSAMPTHTLQIILNLTIFVLLVLAASGLTIWYVAPASDADFVLLIDSSSSMSAEDIEPSRMDLTKEIALSILNGIPHSTRTAVVSFSGTSFVEQPPTDDLQKAEQAINNIKIRDVGGTDIPSAIITGTNLLSSENRSKIAVLISDGVSTVGLPIEDGIEFAKANHMIVNSIGVGTELGGDILSNEEGEEEKITMLDEESLKTISNSTSGKYYRYKDLEDLKKFSKDITQTSYQKVSLKLSPVFITVIILLILLEWTLSFTKFSRVP